MKYAQDVTGLVGNTPLVQIKSGAVNGNIVLGKCEFMNPTHSVKDRIGSYMLKAAREKGLINNNTTLIESTSGNTGIALAAACAGLGMKLILTMPSSMSLERRKLLKALGAELVLTDASQGMKGAVTKAEELHKQIENSFLTKQFVNPANAEIHRRTTAHEILTDTKGKVDIVVAAVGTGGSITGIGEVLKKHNPRIKIVAVEPAASAVLSGKSAGFHKIQGIGAGFVPEILNTQIYDEVISVSDEEAMATTRALALKEGLLVGISAGANVYASIKIAQQTQDKVIVTILCDTGERYLSSDLYE